jgi:hypothetical protein
MVQVLAGRPVAGGGQRARAMRGLDAVKLATDASEALEEEVTTRHGSGLDGHAARRLPATVASPTARSAATADRLGLPMDDAVLAPKRNAWAFE